MGGGGDDDDSFLENPVGAIGGYLEDWRKDPLGQAAQHASLGIYDREKGKASLKNFYLYKFFDESIGEVTGRNAGRYGARQQQKAIDAERVARKREADLLWLDRYRRDSAASSSAAGIRASADARSRVAGSGQAAAAEKLGGTSEDLLGV